MWFLLMLLSLLLVAGTTRADQISLRPPGSAVELRTYGFGLIPFDGNFSHFDGWIRYDPSSNGVCQVMLEMEAGMAMANSSICSQGTIIAMGHLRRAEWGITGSPLMGGSIIRIGVVLPDPASTQHT